MSYKLIKNVNTARRGEFTTVHGTVQTPTFMNVATTAAIKGGLSTKDLEDIRCQVMLCNTYHLHLRPTDKIVHDLVVCISLQTGKDQFLQTVAGFRCSHLQSCVK